MSKSEPEFRSRAGRAPAVQGVRVRSAGRMLATALLILGAMAGTARASATPGLDGTLGRTLAISGMPDEGGFSASLAPMWPVEDRFSFGVMFLADDMGSQIGRLIDPNDGVDLGAVATGHTTILGVAWRLDREWGALNTWLPYVSGTWGYYRATSDVRGAVVRRTDSTGFSLAGGVRRAINDRYAVGASVRYHRLFNDQFGRYVAWAVDWNFR